MNSYFYSIQNASAFGLFPELSDCWRSYHPHASFSDLTPQDLPFETIEDLQLLRQQNA